MPLDYLPIMARRTTNPRKLVQSSRLAWHPAVRSPASPQIALLTSAAIRRASQPNYMPPDDSARYCIMFIGLPLNQASTLSIIMSLRTLTVTSVK